MTTKLDKENNEKKKVGITIGSDEHWDWIEKQFAKISDETMTTDIPTTTLESILFLMLGVFIHIERDLTLQTIALQEIAKSLEILTNPMSAINPDNIKEIVKMTNEEINKIREEGDR